MKRARSCMVHFLTKSGQKDQYAKWPTAKKKEFLEKFHADKMATASRQQTTTRSVTHTTTSRLGYTWMCKKEMVDRYGESKADAKIKSNKLESQPDPDTGGTGELDLEYKVWAQAGGTNEADSHINAIAGTLDIGDNTLKATTESLDSMATAMGLRTVTALEPVVDSKKEETQQEPKEDPHAKTCEALAKDVKRILRNVSEAIITLKKQYKETKDQTSNESYVHLDFMNALCLRIHVWWGQGSNEPQGLLPILYSRICPSMALDSPHIFTRICFESCYIGNADSTILI
jgi:hypothetical protein